MKIEEAVKNAKACPFCGSSNFDISHKSNGHIAVFCKGCHTYGPRVLEYIAHDKDVSYKYHFFKSKKDRDTNTNGLYFENVDNSEVSHEWYYEEAVNRWNKRV